MNAPTPAEAEVAQDRLTRPVWRGSKGTRLAVETDQEPTAILESFGRYFWSVVVPAVVGRECLLVSGRSPCS